MPSFILYSCPQLPHTILPSRTSVSRRRVCRSRITFSEEASLSEVVSTVPTGGEGSTIGGEIVGFSLGTVVKPSYKDLKNDE